MDEKKVGQAIFETLNRWLVRNSIAEEKARVTTNRLQTFCSNQIGQRLSCPVDLGITVKRSKQGGITVWLCVLWPSSLPLDVIGNNRLLNSLIEIFAYEVEIPLLPNLSVHFEHILSKEIAPQFFTSSLRSLRKGGRKYIGVFRVPHALAAQPPH